jgi:hypothetical protein
MARSKIFEALFDEAGKQAKKGGDALKGTPHTGEDFEALLEEVGKEEVPKSVKPPGIKTISSKKNKAISPKISKTDKKPREQTPKQTVTRADSHSSGQPNRQISRHSSRQLNEHSTEHTTGQPTGHTIKHSTGQPSEHFSEKSFKHSAINSFGKPFSWMTQNQKIVFSFLVDNKNQILTYDSISLATGVPYGSVRRIIKRLTQRKYLSPPQRYRDGAIQGLSYNIDEKICQQFKEQEFFEHSIGHSIGHTTGHTIEQSFAQSDGRTFKRADNRTVDYNSSSSFLKKTTTWLDNELATNPELGYWRQKGLTAKQIQNWIKEAGCDPELMIQYLCYCRFEMIDLGLEKSKPIHNVFNWFWKIIEKTCSYPQPQGYKSFQEKQIEEKTKLLERKKAEIEKIEKVERELAEAEIEEQFRKMMADPESEQYQRCFERLSALFQKRARKGGRAFEDAMRKEFKEEWKKG